MRNMRNTRTAKGMDEQEFFEITETLKNYANELIMFVDQINHAWDIADDEDLEDAKSQAIDIIQALERVWF